jgi:ubiquinone/menaquinone biosynthesis C-methylase UbiE
MKQNKQVDYDSISRIYDVGRVAKPDMVKKLIRLLQVDKNSHLLDLGCGTGNYTAELQKAAKSVVGIDISKGMIDQAKAKFPEMKFICGDVSDLPFDSEAFDGAFSIQVLHHVKKREIFLKETHRVLRQGGYIAIDSCSHKQMRACWYYHYFPQGLEKDLTRIPDSEQIISMLEKAGFSDIGIEISYVDVAIDHDVPKRYLDKNYRNSISTFSLLSEKEIRDGCEKIKSDIASGDIEKVVQKFEAKRIKAGSSSVIYGQKI